MDTFRVIGSGTCGTIFEIPGSLEVIKRAKDGYENELWNDSLVHRCVKAAFEKWKDIHDGLSLPGCYDFVTAKNDDFWRLHTHLFPEYFQQPAALFFTQRILPLPKPIRFAIIDTYFPEQIRLNAKLSQANKDCLVRIYLGKRRDPNRRKPLRASLRNYNMHLDQMEELEMDIIQFATVMAKGLAILHWEAQTDADDVEFVLGSGPTMFSGTTLEQIRKMDGPTDTLPTSSIPNFGQRFISMYLLDFNRCKQLELRGTSEDRENSVKMAVDAFFRNDPYYPRPPSSNDNEKLLWDNFSQAYLYAASKILSTEEDVIQQLPKQFIHCIEETMKVRRLRMEEAGRRLEAMGILEWEE